MKALPECYMWPLLFYGHSIDISPGTSGSTLNLASELFDYGVRYTFTLKVAPRNPCIPLSIKLLETLWHPN